MNLDLTLLSLLPGGSKVLSMLAQMLPIATALVALASALAAVIPHPQKMDGWLATVRRAVDWLALNVGHATPATLSAPQAAPSSAPPSSSSPGATMKNIAVLLIAGGCAFTFALVACTLPKTPDETVFDLRASYDAAVLVPMVHYTALPTCVTGTPAAIAAPCKDPTVVASLVKADTSAKAAFDAAEDIVRNHPTLDASAAIAAATDAVSVATTIIATYGIK